MTVGGNRSLWPGAFAASSAVLLLTLPWTRPLCLLFHCPKGRLMARWAAPAACLALAGVLLCLPALSGGSRGLAASPAPSAGSPNAQTADTPAPPAPPPPPPSGSTPPPAGPPPSTPPPSKTKGTGSQGGTSKVSEAAAPGQPPVARAAAMRPTCSACLRAAHAVE